MFDKDKIIKQILEPDGYILPYIIEDCYWTDYISIQEHEDIEHDVRHNYSTAQKNTVIDIKILQTILKNKIYNQN